MCNLYHEFIVKVQLPNSRKNVLNKLISKIFRIRAFIIDIPIESIFEANAINSNIEFKSTDAAIRLYLACSIAGDSLADGVSDVAFKMR